MGDARGFGQQDRGSGPEPAAGTSPQPPQPAGTSQQPAGISLPPGATSLRPSQLRAVLETGTVFARVDAIRRTRPAPGLESVLLEALSDPEGEVRLAAVEAIARWGGTRARRGLVRMAASDPWPPVRARSMEALGDILVRLTGEDEPEAPRTAGRGA
jgi:HEAT repeats